MKDVFDVKFVKVSLYFVQCLESLQPLGHVPDADICPSVQMASVPELQVFEVQSAPRGLHCVASRQMCMSQSTGAARMPELQT